MVKMKRRQGPNNVAEKEYEQRMIDIARVTRVMAGGKRMRFRACVAIGNRNGRCGIGLAKGADVTLAINKAVNQAKKNMVDIPLINGTIPHRIYIKHGAAKILLKPAPLGTGVKAGGAVRMVLELAGVPNIVAKIMGTNNKVNNVRGLLVALQSFVLTEKDKKTKSSTVDTVEKNTDQKKEVIKKVETKPSEDKKSK